MLRLQFLRFFYLELKGHKRILVARIFNVAYINLLAMGHKVWSIYLIKVEKGSESTNTSYLEFSGTLLHFSNGIFINVLIWASSFGIVVIDSIRYFGVFAAIEFDRIFITWPDIFQQGDSLGRLDPRILKRTFIDVLRLENCTVWPEFHHGLALVTHRHRGQVGQMLVWDFESLFLMLRSLCLVNLWGHFYVFSVWLDFHYSWSSIYIWHVTSRGQKWAKLVLQLAVAIRKQQYVAFDLSFTPGLGVGE